MGDDESPADRIPTPDTTRDAVVGDAQAGTKSVSVGTATTLAEGTDTAKAKVDDAKATGQYSEVVTNAAGKVVEQVQTLAASGDAGSAVTALSRQFREELNKPENKDSLFLNAAYQICSLLENYFQISMDADDYSNAIDEIYPDAKFDLDEAQAVKIFAKRECYDLIKVYKAAKTKDPADTATMEAAKKAILEIVKKDPDLKLSEEQFDENLAELEKALEKFADGNIADSDLAKLKATDAPESAISAHYVYRQLQSMYGDALQMPKDNKGENPEILYAQLRHTQVKKDGANYFLFTQELDYSAIAKKPINSLKPGTVLFFNLVSGDNKLEVVSGIVGLDGKLRFHTKDGVKAVGNYGENLDNLMQSTGSDDGEDKDVKNWQKSSFSSFFASWYRLTAGMSASVRFRGAFIPNLAAAPKAE